MEEGRSTKGRERGKKRQEHSGLRNRERQDEGEWSERRVGAGMRNQLGSDESAGKEKRRADIATEQNFEVTEK